jgi:hypothetical protein
VETWEKGFSIKTSLALLAAVAVIGIILVAGFSYLYINTQNDSSKNQPPPSPIPTDTLPPSTPTSSPTQTPQPTPTGPTFKLQNDYTDIGTSSYKCWVYVLINRVSNVLVNNVSVVPTFAIQYKESSSSGWSIMTWTQAESGITTVKTPNFKAGTSYDFKICVFEDAAVWSDTKSISTMPNRFPPAPSGSINKTSSGIMIQWSDLTSLGYKDLTYNVYQSINNGVHQTTLMKIATTTNTTYLYHTTAAVGDISEIFYVTCEFPGVFESDKSFVGSIILTNEY